MINLTKRQFVAFWIFLLAMLPFLFYFLHVVIPFHGDEIRYDGDTSWGFPHSFFVFLCFAAWVVVLVSGGMALDKNGAPGKFLGCITFPCNGVTPPEPNPDVNSGMSKGIKKLLWTLAIFAVLGVLYRVFGSSANQMKFVYNTSKVYHDQYQQHTMERQGFYDKLWKTYLQKEKVMNLNRDMFIQVSKIIMENRKDGQNVTWKWVKENQNIPYDEFAKFYNDLSAYIELQREEYYGLEKQCQTLATANNMLLDTFPNNLYNRALGCTKIEFSYGFLSDSTDHVFATKKENVN